MRVGSQQDGFEWWQNHLSKTDITFWKTYIIGITECQKLTTLPTFNNKYLTINI